MWYKTTTNQPTYAIENNDEEHNARQKKKTRTLVPKAKLFQKM